MDYEAIYKHGIDSTVTIRGIEYRCDKRFFTEKWSKLRIKDYCESNKSQYFIDEFSGIVYFDERQNEWVAVDDSECDGVGATIGEALQNYVNRFKDSGDFDGGEVFESIQMKYVPIKESEQELAVNFWIKIVCW